MRRGESPTAEGAGPNVFGVQSCVNVVVIPGRMTKV